MHIFHSLAAILCTILPISFLLHVFTATTLKLSGFHTMQPLPAHDGSPVSWH